MTWLENAPQHNYKKATSPPALILTLQPRASPNYRACSLQLRTSPTHQHCNLLKRWNEGKAARVKKLATHVIVNYGLNDNQFSRPTSFSKSDKEYQ